MFTNKPDTAGGKDAWEVFMMALNKVIKAREDQEETGTLMAEMHRTLSNYLYLTTRKNP